VQFLAVGQRTFYDRKGGIGGGNFCNHRNTSIKTFTVQMTMPTMNIAATNATAKSFI
jgi:hypothetical protein